MKFTEVRLSYLIQIYCGRGPCILRRFLTYIHHPVKWSDWAPYTKSAHVSKKTTVASPGAWQAYLGLDYVMSCIIQPCLPFSCHFPTCSDRSVTQLSISVHWDAPTEPTNHWDQPKSGRIQNETIRRTSLDYRNTVVLHSPGYQCPEMASQHVTRLYIGEDKDTCVPMKNQESF